jgi:putative nucleotidyltransferase with HDIG domain
MELTNWDCDDRTHCFDGHKLLTSLDPILPVSNIILYHHDPWIDDGTIDRKLASIINVASSIVIKIDPTQYILNSSDKIINYVLVEHANFYLPEAVDALLDISKEEAFWLDLTSPSISDILAEYYDWHELGIRWNDIQSIAQVFSLIIDSKSQFTLEHSIGVTNVARQLAIEMGFSELQLSQMTVAGLLHDLGKLSVPDYILDKPGPLNNREMLLMKQHTYHTYRILSRIEGFSDIAKWAAYHHERLDGNGYPFRLKGKNLPLGSRVMAVADVFQALNQKRPYRDAMQSDDVIRIMRNQVNSGALDSSIVEHVFTEYDLYAGLARHQ